MKPFIKYIVLLMMLFTWIKATSQELNIVSIERLQTDLYARTNPRTDNHGNYCAVVRIGIPSLMGITFDESVGEVSYNAGEYIFYVSPNTPSISVRNSSKDIICTIDFEANGYEIESKAAYRVLLATKEMRDVVFNLTPADAYVKIGEEEIQAKDGLVVKSLQVGEELHDYTVHAKGYHSISGSFVVEEDNIPFNINLQPITYRISLDVNVKRYTLFVDGAMVEPQNDCIELTEGSHYIRVVAEKYDDYSTTLNVNQTMNKSISVEMIRSNDYFTRTKKSLRARISIYGGGGLIFLPEEEDSGTDYNFRIGFDCEWYWGRYFSFRPAIEAIAYPKEGVINEEDGTIISVNVPLLFNINKPLGRMNNKHFSVGVGPLLGIAFDTSSDDSDDNKDFVGGGRIEARLILNHFILGVNADYVKDNIIFCSHINTMLTLGYRF